MRYLSLRVEDCSGGCQHPVGLAGGILRVVRGSKSSCLPYMLRRCKWSKSQREADVRQFISSLRPQIDSIWECLIHKGLHCVCSTELLSRFALRWKSCYFITVGSLKKFIFHLPSNWRTTYMRNINNRKFLITNYICLFQLLKNRAIMYFVSCFSSR